MDDLPKEVDVIILGTGLPESIVAAACSRIDKSIIQLDSCSFYGRDWAGFRFQELRDFLKEASLDVNLKDIPRTCLSINENSIDNVPLTDVSFLLDEGELLVPLASPDKTIIGFEERIYLREEIVEPDIAPQARQDRYQRLSGRQGERSDSGGSSEGSPRVSVSEPVEREVRQKNFQDILDQSKKFSLDIAPKLFWTNDAFIELLISSNVSRYCSFRLVKIIAALIENRIVEVPFSRSAIFNYSSLSPIDKRKVMQFMQFCLDLANRQTLEELRSVTIGDHLEQLKIPSAYIMSIISAIALGDRSMLLPKAVENVRRFLTACGRYGLDSGPFLFPVYGCGEYPQYFARVSAIFGGIQCLKRGIDFIVTNSSGTVITGIISNGQKVQCSKVVLPVGYLPKAWRRPGVELSSMSTSRAILLTDRSLFSKSNPDAGFMRISSKDGVDVTLVEASSTTEICPPGYHIIYMWAQNNGSSARQQLEPVALTILEPYRSDKDNPLQPSVLWACYYTHRLFDIPAEISVSDDNGLAAPNNVQFVKGPSGNLDYEDTLDESISVFQKLFPGQPFLPRIPDPEDVIIEGGESTEKLELNAS